MAKVDERGTADWVVDQAAVFLGVKPASIKTASPQAKYRERWQTVAYAAWTVSECSAVEIGRAMGGADHSRILVAREMVRARIAKEPEFRDRVAKLLEDLRIALF
jgi:chromosomal replication initiation ATPase DnaA